MASLRKKYAPQVETPSADNDAPIASTPVQGAEPPPQAVETKPPQPPTTEKQSPADEAAKDALRQRLAEMERAEMLVHQQQPQQAPQHLAAEPQLQPPTTEQIIANARVPDRAKNWLRQHPEFITDPAKNNTLVALHDVAKRMSGEEFSDFYFQQLDNLLGFGQQPQQRQPQPNGNGHAPAAPARNGAQPVWQQQRPAGPAVSAPPSRESPSMTTGRATGHRAPLTEAEVEIARGSGLSPEEYQQQKEKMLRLKAAGAVQ
jgi:hypothetical protein